MVDPLACAHGTAFICLLLLSKVKSRAQTQVVECSPMDLSISSALAKATPQLGPYRPSCQASAGSLRDFLQNGIKQKRFFDSGETVARPYKRKKDGSRRDGEFVEVLAEGDW